MLIWTTSCLILCSSNFQPSLQQCRGTAAASTTHILGQSTCSHAQMLLAGVCFLLLGIVIQSFDIAILEAQMSVMARPAYTGVSNMLE